MFWGGNVVAARFLAVVHEPTVLAALRFSVASVALLIVLGIRGDWRRRRLPIGYPAIAIGALGVALFNVCFFDAMRTITAGRAALLSALFPILMAVITTCFFHEPITMRRRVGIAIALLGVALVLTDNDHGILSLHLYEGDLFMLVAVLAWAGATLVGRYAFARSENQASLDMTATSTFCGTGILLALAWPRLPATLPLLATLSRSGALIYMGVFGSALAYVWYYDGVQRIGTMRASIFTNLEPLFGVFFGALLLGEPLGATLLIGAPLVLLGIFLTTVDGRREGGREVSRHDRAG